MDFRVKKIQTNSMQTADVIHNYGFDWSGDLPRRVQDLQRIAAAEGSAELDAAIQEVANEVGATEPSKGRLVAAIERVKLLAVGMGAAAEITTSAEHILGAINGLS